MNPQNTEHPSCLIIGDNCVDLSTFLELSTRANPEDPRVPLYHKVEEHRTHGMAHNYARVLSMMNVAGSIKLLVDPHNKALKHRTFVRESPTAPYKYLSRVDQDFEQFTPPHSLDDLDADFIVIADYCKGAITSAVMENIPIDTPVYVDTKRSDPTIYTGCTVKMNDAEFNATKKYHYLFKRIIHTKGAEGAELIYPQDSRKNLKVKASGSEVVNVSGAGDVFFATFIACEQYLKYPELSALKCATVAAGLSIQHHTVFIPTPEEINEAIRK